MRRKLNLIVVAHPDDEILGFGGTGAGLVLAGEIVQPIIMCGEVDARAMRPSDSQLLQDITAANAEVGFQMPILGDFPNLRMNAVSHVEIVQFIEEHIRRFQPARVFTHFPRDLNNDHLQVSTACQAAVRLFQRRADVPPLDAFSFMEVLSSTEWGFNFGGDVFSPNCFFEVGDLIERKIKALRHYRNVMRDFPHPRSEEVIRALAAYRGAQAGMKYAESFQMVFQRGL